MKKLLMLIIAVFAMVTANATDYTGTVSNMQMGSKHPSSISGITFSVNNYVLTGYFTVPNVTPPHTIVLTANLTQSDSGYEGEAYGTVTVYSVIENFTGDVTVSTLSSTNLEFDFDGETENGQAVSFHFSGTAN